ncbi:cryptochrome-2 [Calycina marina]|uniref:Cryptochrome-2 n=1 Tax=Calycina marina TaxID=1763456 RepID=A0A9P7YXU6_9HELO|nr:cryptochrome-2 [Calycina marina]
MSKPRVIWWIRTDLRLHDNLALQAALDLGPEAFWPVWTWDPKYVYRTRVGCNRWQFLTDCQRNLSESITKLNKKSKLFLIREAPQTLFPKLFKAWKITHLVFEKDTDPYGKDRDAVIIKAAQEAGVEVIVKHGRTLWDSDELVEKNHGKPLMSISQVQAAGLKVGDIARPMSAPISVPDPGTTDMSFEQQPSIPKPDFQRDRERQDKSYEKLIGPNGDFAVPTLEELGIPAATSQIRGGETEALKQLNKILSDKKYTATFAKPDTAPTAFEPQSTTLLSPHLHFGSLSIREFWWGVQNVLKEHKGKHSEPPTSLLGQLLFRDMYFGAQAKLGYSFNQTLYNDHCRFVPWHLPSRVDHETKRVTGDYHIDSPEAEEWFQRWKWGRTGFPWIDALMRQLRQEGWIHHLGRHAVACFLTRGGCYISWERGADVFEEWLLDHESACNAGNWQWLSCTAFYAQYYRCYSPIVFPQKTDKDGAFVIRYCPELKDLPAKYIYEPWKAPLQDQKKAGVRITGDGKDPEKGTYPKPMFDFSERRNICIERMKTAYKVNLYGNDSKAIDGTWKTLFADSAEGPTERNSFKDAMKQDGDEDNIQQDDTGKGHEAVKEKGEEAAETDGDNKRGDIGGSKRKRALGCTLDGFVRKSKK